MTTEMVDETVRTIIVRKDTMIAASLEITFQALLEQLGPQGEMPDGRPLPMVFEAWPGGRWYRDLGQGAGHFWGHVQVIKPPTLIEICGPLFMSFPSGNHVKYRLTDEGDRTRLQLTHRSFGLIPPDLPPGMDVGWTHVLKRVREIADRLVSGR